MTGGPRCTTRDSSKTISGKAVGPHRDLPASLAKVRGGAFYLHGEDDFRKEEVVRALIEVHLDPETRDFNFDPLRGTEVDAETLASVLGTPPMMADWRVVVIREVEGLASSPRARDILLGFVAKRPPGLALILSCSVPQGSKARFYKDLARTAQALSFPSITAADVPGWLIGRGRERYGVEIDIDAAQSLGAAMGSNLGVLTQELEKLSEFVGDRKHIGLADVEAAGTSLPSQDRWRWFDLVGERKFEEALDSLGVLMGQGEGGVALVIGLTTHLLRVGIVAERGSQALEAVLPPHQKWLAGRLGSQARRWQPGEVDGALEGLLHMDRLLKSSPLSEEHHVEAWLLGLMALEAAA